MGYMRKKLMPTLKIYGQELGSTKRAKTTASYVTRRRPNIIRHRKSSPSSRGIDRERPISEGTGDREG
ncbi:hypothetical protein EVAR_83844_1 [Eumeta japonica]|uniref:Uncharacterized protein n=1 Tax=Eumeta variegata TaxID=151549 RepID=A0A4C1UR66_EUMVA|nr:hypothetical protein EVAR_83844_1 [Eumeta japonica]